ncbi:MAG: GIY-YIG nuclease family protein, partial [Bacteroidota bacterium]
PGYKTSTENVGVFSSMYIVYAISRLTRTYIYVGLTSNLQNRIERHNKGYERTTKPYAPFKVIYTKKFPTRPEERSHEKHMKSGSGKEKLRQIRDNSAGLSTDR